MKKIKNTVPVNYDLFVWSYHWENKTSIIIIIIKKEWVYKGASTQNIMFHSKCVIQETTVTTGH